MARRRNREYRSNRQSNSRRSTVGRSRKSEAEAQVERLTWGALVAIFAVLQILPENSLPNWLTPLAGGLVLMFSGFYQYQRHWRVSPFTWIAGGLMLSFAFINYRVNPNLDFLGVTLITFAVVIVIGVFTGET